MYHSIVLYFTRIAGCLLLLSATFKLAAGFGDSTNLLKVDPIIPMQTGYLLLWAGGLELSAALLVFWLKAPRYRLATICWVASSLASYRMAISLTNSPSMCFCWGNLGDFVYLRPYTLDRISQLVLAYLFIGGFYLFYKDLKCSETGSPVTVAPPNLNRS